MNMLKISLFVLVSAGVMPAAMHAAAPMDINNSASRRDFSSVPLTVAMLDFAYRISDFDLIEYLVEAGVNINHRFSDGYTLFQRAVIDTNMPMIRCIYPLDESIDDQKLLIFAVNNCNHELVDFLVNVCSVDPNQEDDGDHILMIAVQNGDECVEVVRVLAHASVVNINWADNNGMTCLMQAIADDRLSIQAKRTLVDIFIDAQADINMQDDEGESAIIYAARVGDAAIIRSLVDAGAADDDRQAALEEVNQEGAEVYDIWNLLDDYEPQGDTHHAMQEMIGRELQTIQNLITLIIELGGAAPAQVPQRPADVDAAEYYRNLQALRTELQREYTVLLSRSSSAMASDSAECPLCCESMEPGVHQEVVCACCGYKLCQQCCEHVDKCPGCRASK